MAAKASYYDLLRRPEWQRKRLEVMSAAGFECEDCGAKEITLNVHHRFYRKGAKPWEYDRGELQCLCEPCHAAATERTRMSQELFGRLSQSCQEVAIGYLAAAVLTADDAGDAVQRVALNFERAEGASHWLGCTWGSIADNAVDGHLTADVARDLEIQMAQARMAAREAAEKATDG